MIYYKDYGSLLDDKDAEEKARATLELLHLVFVASKKK